MPYVDGKFSRSAGQGYARAKAMGGGEKHEDSPPVEGDKGSTGSVLHVKHHGGGKFSTKDEHGEVMKHDSPEEMHSHMMNHFGVQDGMSEGGDEDYSDESMGDSGEALKSILG